VLKSWAIPKEPPTVKNVKRLAIQTEDHPIEYANFEGVIPEGEYGAGTVEIWDRGTFNVEEWTDEKIIVYIRGEKLKGRYCLIKFKGRENSWLFFKA
ncbi:MAG: DNA polymerase ligase N-terminal domain-containing protein, partial [Candidatus Bathyarchaeia archaeon]